MGEEPRICNKLFRETKSERLHWIDLSKKRKVGSELVQKIKARVAL